jgi:hypothetical protein
VRLLRTASTKKFRPIKLLPDSLRAPWQNCRGVVRLRIMRRTAA